MDKPLVSIIIPVYNSEKYLGKTIESVINQIYKPIEIIIVNDGSTDQSLEIASTYKSDTVKVLSQANKGASAARNRGLKEANGVFIQFLDADDLLSADKIARQVDLLIINPGKIAVCSTIHFTDGQNIRSLSPSSYEENFLIDADPVHFLINLWGGFGENGSMVQPNAWLSPIDIVKKSGSWDENLSLDDDGEYFCRILLNSTGVLKSQGRNYYRKQSSVNSNLSAAFKMKDILSQFKSLQLRFQHINANNPSVNLKIAYLRSLHILKFKMYPQYPGVARLIEDAINKVDYDIDYKYLFATPVGNTVSRIIGWKSTKTLQSMLRKLR